MKRFLLLFAVLTNIGCYAAPSDDPVVNFDAVWEEFDLLYGGFGIRQVDWDAQYDEWRPTIDENSSETELFEALTGMLAVFDDTHVELQTPNRELWKSGHIYEQKLYDDEFDLEVAKTYLDEPEIGPYDSYVRGMIGDDIGYVWFPWIDDNTFAIDALIDSGVSRIIVDLRHNGGGAYTYALEAFGRVTSEDIEVFRTRTRIGPDGEFDDWWTTKMLSRGETYDGEVIVLTDRWTVSAGERLVMALQEVPGVVTMGLPTNGAISTKVPRDMPNGWIYTIAVQEVEHMDGRVSEGPGVPVDIEVRNDPAVLATGVDQMLEAALEYSF